MHNNARVARDKGDISQVTAGIHLVRWSRWELRAHGARFFLAHTWYLYSISVCVTPRTIGQIAMLTHATAWQCGELKLYLYSVLIRWA